MNKQTIYVVIAYGGMYEDAWEQNVCARFSEEDAQLTILDLEQRSEKLKAILQPVQDIYFATIRQSRAVLEKVPEPPKGPKKGTKENMAAHKLAVQEWRALTDPMIKRNDQQWQDIYKNATLIAREKAVELGADEVDLRELGFEEDGFFRAYSRNFDCDYRYEELEIE